jgi:hypothetical protein
MRRRVGVRTERILREIGANPLRLSNECAFDVILREFAVRASMRDDMFASPPRSCASSTYVAAAHYESLLRASECIKPLAVFSRGFTERV